MTSKETKAKDWRELVTKFDEIKKLNKADLSLDQDLSIAIMNLVSIEEHLVFSGAKTGKTGYYDLIQEVREMRKSLMQKLIKDYEGEVWCISKHLLGASYRLLEVGTKLLDQGKNDESYDMFGKAYDLYALFWAINLKMVDVKGINKISDDALNKREHTKKHKEGSGILMTKFKGIIQKVIDCCIE